MTATDAKSTEQPRDIADLKEELTALVGLTDDREVLDEALMLFNLKINARDLHAPQASDEDFDRWEAIIQTVKDGGGISQEEVEKQFGVL